MQVKLTRVVEENMSAVLPRLLESELHADVVLLLEDQTVFKAHKCFLSSSPVLKEVLMSLEFRLDRLPHISLPGFSKDSVAFLLHFLYKGFVVLKNSTDKKEFLQLCSTLKVNPPVIKDRGDVPSRACSRQVVPPSQAFDLSLAGDELVIEEANKRAPVSYQQPPHAYPTQPPLTPAQQQPHLYDYPDHTEGVCSRRDVLSSTTTDILLPDYEMVAKEATNREFQEREPEGKVQNDNNNFLLTEPPVSDKNTNSDIEADSVPNKPADAKFCNSLRDDDLTERIEMSRNYLKDKENELQDTENQNGRDQNWQKQFEDVQKYKSEHKKLILIGLEAIRQKLGTSERRDLEEASTSSKPSSKVKSQAASTRTCEKGGLISPKPSSKVTGQAASTRTSGKVGLIKSKLRSAVTSQAPSPLTHEKGGQIQSKLRSAAKSQVASTPEEAGRIMSRTKSAVKSIPASSGEARSNSKQRCKVKRKVNLDESTVDIDVILERTVSKEKEAMASKVLKLEEPSPPNHHECNFCKKSFTSAAPLVSHLEKHYTKSGKFKFDCPFPTCMFAANSLNLTNHMRSTHTKEQLFICSSCPIKFYTRNALVAHEKKHSNPTVWGQCKKCRRFYQVIKGSCRCDK